MSELARKNKKIHSSKKERQQVCDGHKLSEDITPTLDFERLLMVGHVSSLLDETTATKTLNNPRKNKLKQELKNNMKNLMTTVLNRYTEYLTQAFQLSIQSQLKQVSNQQATLMKVFQQSIKQTLELMHRPHHFNPSVVTDNPDKYNKQINLHSINTRKLNDLRFRLENASQDITTLKDQNKKLQEKVNRLQLQLKKKTSGNDELSLEEANNTKLLNSSSIKKLNLWEYIDFFQKHSDRYQIDLNHMSKLIKKRDRSHVNEIENCEDAFKDLKVKLSRVGSEKCELKKQLQECERKNATIQKEMEKMESKYDKKHKDVEQQLQEKMNCEMTKIKSLGHGLNLAVENMQIQMTCQCCLSQLKNPVLLKCCGHTICQTCVQTGNNDKTTLICGECQHNQEQESMVKLPILQNIANRFESVRYHAEKISQ